MGDTGGGPPCELFGQLPDVVVGARADVAHPGPHAHRHHAVEEEAGKHQDNSNVSAMQPPCYPFLEEIPITGVLYESLG